MGLITNTVTNATSGILSGFNRKFDMVTGVAKGILCLPQLFSPKNLKNLTANVGKALVQYANGVVAGLTNFVTSTIVRHIQNITGVISSQLRLINDFIKDINESITLIKQTAKSLVTKVKNTLDFLKDTENCSFAAAELGKCIISDILDDVPRATAKQLVNGSLDLNKKVSDITNGLTHPSKSITKYLNQSQMLANKASIQQLF